MGNGCLAYQIKNRPLERGPREDFKIGGIVGSVEIVDCVSYSQSYWFSGRYGFVLKNARRTSFRPVKGRLGFWEADNSSHPTANRASTPKSGTPAGNEFVAYHRTDVMGHDYRAKRGKLLFFSRKSRAFLEKAIGGNVWVITGKRDSGRGMLYRLAGVHTPDEVRDRAGVSVIVGKRGHVFVPPVELNSLPWFQTLFREQSLFSFGFNRIGNRVVIEALHRLKAAVQLPAAPNTWP